jgi:hypothetical protein
LVCHTDRNHAWLERHPDIIGNDKAQKIITVRQRGCIPWAKRCVHLWFTPCRDRCPILRTQEGNFIFIKPKVWNTQYCNINRPTDFIRAQAR